MFRLMGDMAHLVSFFFLIHRLRERRTAVGISLRSQQLYLIVFVARYLDLFTHFYSLYNTLMKIFYIAASAWVVYMIDQQQPWKSTYESALDSFQHWKFAVAPCAALALLVNEGSWAKQSFLAYVYEVAWAFSIYLEAIGIVPQLIMTQRHKAVENITSWYMASLGSYRALYLMNWVYRYMTEPHYRAWIPWIAGVVQTAIFAGACRSFAELSASPPARLTSPVRADFLYYFVLSKSKGHKHVILPT